MGAYDDRRDLLSQKNSEAEVKGNGIRPEPDCRQLGRGETDHEASDIGGKIEYQSLVTDVIFIY